MKTLMDLVKEAVKEVKEKEAENVELDTETFVKAVVERIEKVSEKNPPLALVVDTMMKFAHEKGYRGYSAVRFVVRALYKMEESGKLVDLLYE